MFLSLTILSVIPIYWLISVHFASYFFGSQTILEVKNRGLNNCEENGNSSLKMNIKSMRLTTASPGKKQTSWVLTSHCLEIKGEIFSPNTMEGLFPKKKKKGKTIEGLEGLEESRSLYLGGVYFLI